MQNALYTQRHDPRASALTQFLTIAFQKLLPISATCAVLQSDDLLYVAQGCRLNTACNLDMTSAVIPDIVPRVLWQQAVTEDNSKTPVCIGLYANAIYACTVSMQNSPSTLSRGTTFAVLPAKTLQQYNGRNAGLYNHKSSAQALVPVRRILMCYASCQSACSHKVMDCIPASAT